MTNFDYLLQDKDYEAFASEAVVAERLYQISAGSCALSCRKAMELAVKWMFAVDKELELPYQDNLVSLMGDETFRDIVGADLLQRMDYIRKLGNSAAHSEKKITKDQAALALENLWYFLDFVAYCYAEDYQGGSFDRTLLDAAPATPPHSSASQTPSPQGEGLETGERIAAAAAQPRNDENAGSTPLSSTTGERIAAAAAQPRNDENAGSTHLSSTTGENVGTSSACPRTSDARPYVKGNDSGAEAQLAALLAENAALREELTARREAQLPGYTPKPLDISEFKTRKLYIDVMLQDAGWIEGKNWLNEVELQGMPNQSGVGYADYVLYGDDGKPLAVVEAKRTCVDVAKGRQQAKLYADLLAQKYHRRPVQAGSGKALQPPDHADKPEAYHDQPGDRGPLLSGKCHQSRLRGLRQEKSPEGPAGHGYRLRQDPDRHRALRCAAAARLDSEYSFPGGP